MKSFINVLICTVILTGSLTAAAGFPYGEAPGPLPGKPSPSLFLEDDPFHPDRLLVRVQGSARFVHERVMGFTSPVSEYQDSFFASFDSAEVFCKPTRFVFLHLGTEPFRTFGYSAKTVTTEDTKTLSVSGMIRSWHISAFAVFTPFLHVGASVRYLGGASVVKGREKNLSDPSDVSSSTVKETYSGWRPEFLAGTSIGKAFGLSGFVSLPAKIIRNADSYWILPLETGIRLTADAGRNGLMETSFFGEAVYANGRNFIQKDGSSREFSPPVFRDSVSLLAGCTFTAGPRSAVILRTGWAWLPFADDRYSDRQTLFFGSLIPIGRGFSFNGEASWSLRSYRGDGVFFDSDSFVQENVFRVSAGASYALK